MTLDDCQIPLQSRAADKQQVANTYLGNGTVIPHGLPENRNLIQRTGIAIVQEGVSWNAGETLHSRAGMNLDSSARLTTVYSPGKITSLSSNLPDRKALQTYFQQVAIHTCSSVSL